MIATPPAALYLPGLLTSPEFVKFAALATALFTMGLFTGFLAGLFGVGGGGVLVPVLYELFTVLSVDPAVRMHLTLGTSMAVMVPTTLFSFSRHYARGAVDMDALRRLGPWMVAGALTGILIAEKANGAALKWVWIVSGSLISLKMALGREDWRLGNDLPRSRLLEGATAAIGTVSTLMSIGGGSFMVSLFTLYGRPVLQAVATSAGFGPLIALPGVAGFIWAGWNATPLPPFSLGYVNLLAAALLAPATLLAVPWGVRLAHGISKRKLELAFAALLAAIVTRFIVSLWA